MRWFDRAIDLYICPVRVITDEAKELIRWFEATHELQLGFGVAIWRRHCLPGPGSLGDQEARLMTALDFVRDLRNGLLMEGRTKKRTRTPGARPRSPERGNERTDG